MSDSFFSGEITVSSRIVDQLSSGLYESPAACLKELINNSFDADATQVSVLIKPDADRIIIEDNGTGITKDDFLKHFKRISESYKRDSGDVTQRGRKKIGKIGIGFIAANEICDTMEIFSTKEGSSELLHVVIHFDKMRLDPAIRRRKEGDLAKGDFTGELLEADAKVRYTQVVLRRVRPNAKTLFAGETNRIKDGVVRSLYGMGQASVVAELSDPKLTSWSEFDSYSQNLLEVALYVPVKYHKGWIAKRVHQQVASFERRVAALDFNVSYDGTDLRKPTVLHPSPTKSCLISKFAFAGDHVAAEGYFYAQHGVIRPHDIHGLLVRIREAAIGGYDQSFWDFPPSEGSIIQRWVSAEIWADDRLEDALNIDRKTLRVAHPAYVELQEAIHRHLTEVISRARSQLYDAESGKRNKQRAAVTVSGIRDVASSIRPISPIAADTMVRTWSEKAVKDSTRNKALLRKFGVVELYEVVVEVAEEILTPTQLAQFVRKLTERLSR